MARVTIADVRKDLTAAMKETRRVERELKQAHAQAVSAKKLSEGQDLRLAEAVAKSNSLETQLAHKTKAVAELVTARTGLAQQLTQCRVGRRQATSSSMLLEEAVTEIASATWPWLSSPLIKRARRALADLAVLQGGTDPEATEPASRRA